MQLSRISIVLGIVCWAGAARGVPRETCMGAAEASQELRKRGKLQSAREQLNVCAHKTCPGFVRKDCVAWLAELDAAMPSLILRARDDAGNELKDVRVLVDGTVVAASLAATSKVEVDPGAHVVRFEREGTFAEERVSLVAGEKGHVVTGTLATTKRDFSPQAKANAPEAPPPETDHVPAGVYVLGATALVGAGAFTFFALSGASEYSDLESTCKPRCTAAQTKSVDTKFLVANVALAVAAASAVGAAVVYFTRPTPASARTTFGIAPLSASGGTGVWAHLGHAF